jgi:hypothetical protein
MELFRLADGEQMIRDAMDNTEMPQSLSRRGLPLEPPGRVRYAGTVGAYQLIERGSALRRASARA